MARKIKMLGLAGAAILVVGAYAGVASASSTTTVCTSSSSPCPSGDVYTGNTNGAQDGNAVLKSAHLGTVTCKSGTANGTITTNPGNPVQGTTSPTWSQCTNASGASCTVTPSGEPYSATTSNTPLATGSNGTFHVSNPNVKVTCGFLSCTYTATSQDASVYNPGNPNAPDPNSGDGQVYYNAVPLTSSNCFNDSATFTGDYDVTTSSGGVLYVQ